MTGDFGNQMIRWNKVRLDLSAYAIFVRQWQVQASMHVFPPFFTYICIRPVKRARKHTTRKPNRSAPTLEISSVHLSNYADRQRNEASHSNEDLIPKGTEIENNKSPMVHLGQTQL